MEENKEKIIVSERNQREVTLKFDGDFEFLWFIKVLATSSLLNKSKIAQDLFDSQFQRIIKSEDLDEIYRNLDKD